MSLLSKLVGVNDGKIRNGVTSSLLLSSLLFGRASAEIDFAYAELIISKGEQSQKIFREEKPYLAKGQEKDGPTFIIPLPEEFKVKSNTSTISAINAEEERKKQEIIGFLSNNLRYSHRKEFERQIKEMSETPGMIDLLKEIEKRFDLKERVADDPTFKETGYGFVKNSNYLTNLLRRFGEGKSSEAVDLMEGVKKKLGLEFRIWNLELYSALADDLDNSRRAVDYFSKNGMNLEIYNEKFGIQGYFLDRIRLLLTEKGMVETVDSVSKELGIVLIKNKKVTQEDLDRRKREWETGNINPQEIFPEHYDPVMEQMRLLIKLNKDPKKREEVLKILKELKKESTVNYESASDWLLDKDYGNVKDLPRFLGALKRLKEKYPKAFEELYANNLWFVNSCVSNKEMEEICSKAEDPEMQRFLEKNGFDLRDIGEIRRGIEEKIFSDRVGIKHKKIKEIIRVYYDKDLFLSNEFIEEIARKDYNGQPLIEAILKGEPRKFMKEIEKRHSLNKSYFRGLIRNNPDRFFEIIKDKRDFFAFYNELVERDKKTRKSLNPRNNDDFDTKQRANIGVLISSEIANNYRDMEGVIDLINALETRARYKFILGDLDGIVGLKDIPISGLMKSLDGLNAGGYRIDDKDISRPMSGFVFGKPLLESRLKDENVQRTLHHPDFIRVVKEVYKNAKHPMYGDEEVGRFSFSDVGLIHSFISDPELLKHYTSMRYSDLYDSVLEELVNTRQSKRMVNDGEVSAQRDLVSLVNLGKTDLYKIKRILDYLADANNIEEHGKRLKVDRDDETSEHGGLIFMVGGKIKFVDIDPGDRGNNGRYSQSKEYEEMAPVSLLVYHNHALKEDNSPYSGTSGMSLFGGGDLGNAARMQRDGLVFTLLGNNTFNVDYYTPEMVEVDLGVYQFIGK